MDASAVKLFKEVGDNLKKREKLDESIAIVDSLLTEGFDSLSCFYLLGDAYAHKKHFAISCRFYEMALALSPNHPAILGNIGSSYHEQGQIEKAIGYLERAIELEPDEPANYTNMCACYTHLGDLDKALDWGLKSMSMKNYDQITPKHNVSQILLRQGKWKEGFEMYDIRIKMPDRKERFYTEDKHDVDWDGTKGLNLVVHGEQGLGDEIMFASMLPDVIKDCNVIYDCNSRLINLMRDSFPNIKVFGTKQQNSDVEWAKSYDIDAKVSICSLAKFYRQKDEDFPKTPYLKADSKIIEKYKKRLEVLGTKPKIGISWYGGATRISSGFRFNPLHNWLDIFKLDCDFISLQYNAEAAEKVHKFNKENGTNIIHWSDTLADYDETAGLLMNLDLVISAPQSVVHLAGALGVPCWRLCARQAMWGHGVQDKDAPWYGSVKNYWQETNGDWKSVMERVGRDLDVNFNS